MLMTCGPWRPISLETYSSRIADLYFTTNVDQSLEFAEVIAKADIEGDGSYVTFEILLNDNTVSTETVKVEKGFAIATFRTYKPELWYPVSYGKQPLYLLKAVLSTGETKFDTASKRFGLRRVEVVQRKLDDDPGTTFFFMLNNVPVFCGGSDWIPGDSFIPRMTAKKYRDWVKLVAEGNQVLGPCSRGTAKCANKY